LEIGRDLSRHLSAGQPAALRELLLPVFGVWLSTVFVGEKITMQLVFGGLLVFTATFLVTVYEERKRLRAAPGAVER
jgi:drug/metabolite transporter (DMT)-like permease